MKKIIALVLAFCTLCLSGCSLPSFSLEDLLPFSGGSSGEAQVQVPSIPIMPTEATETFPTEATTLPEETTEPTIPAMQWPSDAPYLPLYWDAINDFRTLINYRTSHGYDSDRLPEVSDTLKGSCSNLKDTISVTVYEMLEGRESDFGYVLYDLNNDKVPELFWVYENYSIIAIFTVYKNKLKLLDNFWSRCQGYVSSNGQYYVHGSSGAADSDTTVYRVDKGKLQEVYRFGSESANNYYGYRYFERTPGGDMDTTSERISQLEDKFPAQIVKYWKSTKLCSLDHIPEKGDAGAKRSSNTKYTPYTQKIKRADQSIYAGPGYGYSWKGTTEEAGTFTITAEVPDELGNLWGRLKSSNSWVNLTEIRDVNKTTLRMTANYPDPDLLSSNKYHSYVCPGAEGEYGEVVAFYAYGTYTEVSIAKLVGSGGMVHWETLYQLSSMNKKKPIVATLPVPALSEDYGIFFKDSSGNEYIYILSCDRSNGEVTLVPFSHP